MDPFVLHNPTEMIFGKDQLAQLEAKINILGRKLLLVYGGGSIKKTGLYDKLQQIFQKNQCEVVELSGVEPNPRVSTVRKGIELIRRHQLEWILAVGGGSVIDASKGIAGGGYYDGDVWDLYERTATASKVLPFGVVLTLSATGSEMNAFSVVTNWETRQKQSAMIAYPTFSILDPVHTFSVPKDHIIYGICDTLAHIFEQYFTHTDNIPLQTGFAETLMKTVIENAYQALADPQDYEARANLMLSSTMALNGLLGMGVQTDWATHSIEHAVSAIYDIPHGGGLAILFPNWMTYVYKENVDRFKRFAIEVWNVSADHKTDEEIALEGIASVRSFFQRIGAPNRLMDYGIGEDQLETMAKKSLPFGPIGAFKVLDESDVLNILKMSL